MKTWAVFYHTIGGVLQEGCGYRSVLYIDGRLSQLKAIATAILWGGKHGWEAFHLERGERLSENNPKTCVFKIDSIFREDRK